MAKPQTPEETARHLRNLCLGGVVIGKQKVGPLFALPTTWDEYFACQAEGAERLSAWVAINDVALHSRCDWDTAERAVEEVIPEVFADYWSALPGRG